MTGIGDSVGHPVNWGIIGCGDVVERKAASGIFAAPNQKIVSAMRNNEEALRAFADRFNVSHVTTDPVAVVNHPDVDMVYIATPPKFHVQYAHLAINAGKGVLVEKPVGRCASEAAEISRLCREAGMTGFASYYRRYQPKFRKVRELLDSGAIGSLVSVRYTFRERLSRGDGWRNDPAVSGGGGFFDLAGHVLDLLELYCGPLAFVSGAAENLHPRDVTEHFTQLHFCGCAADGSPVHGSATWNFAAADTADELILEGIHGRIRCSGLKQAGEVVLEVNQILERTWKGSVFNRARKKLRNRFRPVKVCKWRFSKPEATHAGLFSEIGSVLGGATANTRHLETAVGISTLMDGALESYYGGREPGFWDHPERWNSPKFAHRNGASTLASALYDDVDAAQIEKFRTRGYAGPFKSDVKGVESLFIPEKERKDIHLKDSQFFRLSTHPSVTRRVAALVGSDNLSIFKTRIHTKVGFTSKTQPKHAIVPWHQDVGAKNGGYDAQGNPVPTYTVWIALDDVGPQSGPLCVIPGTHTKLFGDYQKNFHADLLETGALTEEEVAQAVPLTMKRGEFCVFHSWLLHGSAPNDTPGRRTGFNIRYVENRKRGTEDYPYVELAPLRR